MCLKCLKCTILPQRVVLGIMGFLGIVVSFTMRSCLSVAITEMVLPLNSSEMENNSTICYIDSISFDEMDGTKPSGTKYNWSQEQQGWILSAYYIGYFISHIPGALLAQKFGGKWMFVFEILTIIICNTLLPPALEYGQDNALILLIILRILMGLGAGPQFPTILVLLAAWIPQKESGKLGTLALGGGAVGIVLSFFFSGLILSKWTWPLVFYFWSLIASVWLIMFIFLCYSDPASHPYISQEERNYLEAEIGQLQRSKTLPITPWKDILTSVPIIALIISQVGSDWCDFVLISDMPKYMRETLGFSVQDVGIYSSFPFLLNWIVSLLSGSLCDYLLSHKHLSVTQARKLFSALDGFIPATLILAASYAGCNRLMFIVCLSLAVGIGGNHYPGMRVNALDLSPNYAGSILSISNGLGSLTGIIVPVFIGMVTPESTLDQWRLVFWTSFCVAMLRTTAFLIWASGEVQPWNEPKKIVNSR